MKALKFTKRTQPLEEQLIVDIEKLIGSRLPSDYRKFILETNGGRPSPENNRFPIVNNAEFDPELNESTVWVDLFLRVLSDDPSNVQIDRTLKRFSDRIPPDMIPIACDACGNMFLLGINGRNRDAVFWWDHELETPGDPYFNVRRLSNSFESFVDGLEPDKAL